MELRSPDATARKVRESIIKKNLTNEVIDDRRNNFNLVIHSKLINEQTYSNESPAPYLPIHVRELSSEGCVDLFREGKFSKLSGANAHNNMDYAYVSQSTMTLLSSKNSQIKSTKNMNAYFGNSPSFTSSVHAYQHQAKLSSH